VNGAGSSAWTAFASALSGATPLSPAPSNLQATQAGDGSVRVTWTDLAGETGYELQSAIGTGAWGTIIAIPANTINYVDAPPMGLTAHYRLRAVNGGGPSAWAETLVYVAPFAMLLQCAAPTGPSAAATSETVIHLAWTKSTNCGGYTVVERAPSATGPWTFLANVLDVLAIGGHWILGNTMDDVGLQPGTTFWYRVKETNGVTGESPYTAPVSATTPTSLTAPTGLVGTATSATTAHLTWIDTSSVENGFVLEVSTSAGGPFAEFSRAGASVTAADVQGLTAGVPAWFQVRAFRGTQLSPPSNTVSVTASGPTSLVATADAVVLESTGFPSRQNVNYVTDPDSVGCFYYWWASVSGVTGPYYNCAYSLLRFDTSALTGHTIRSATLRLTVCGLAPEPALTAYAVFALSSAWNPATVTFNTAPQLHNTDGWYNPAPTSGGVVEWDVTAMAQKWAAGTWASDGIVLMPYQPSPPGVMPPSASVDHTTAFCSLESAVGHPSWAPVLVVDYQ
jgi:hypothetical protein